MSRLGEEEEVGWKVMEAAEMTHEPQNTVAETVGTVVWMHTVSIHVYIHGDSRCEVLDLRCCAGGMGSMDVARTSTSHITSSNNKSSHTYIPLQVGWTLCCVWVFETMTSWRGSAGFGFSAPVPNRVHPNALRRRRFNRHTMRMWVWILLFVYFILYTLALS